MIEFKFFAGIKFQFFRAMLLLHSIQDKSTYATVCCHLSNTVANHITGASCNQVKQCKMGDCLKESNLSRFKFFSEEPDNVLSLKFKLCALLLTQMGPTTLICDTRKWPGKLQIWPSVISLKYIQMHSVISVAVHFINTNEAFLTKIHKIYMSLIMRKPVFGFATR